jgi:hypothetical protein
MGVSRSDISIPVADAKRELGVDATNKSALLEAPSAQSTSVDLIKKKPGIHIDNGVFKISLRSISVKNSSFSVGMNNYLNFRLLPGGIEVISKNGIITYSNDGKVTKYRGDKFYYDGETILVDDIPVKSDDPRIIPDAKIKFQHLKAVNTTQKHTPGFFSCACSCLSSNKEPALLNDSNKKQSSSM